MVIAAGGIAFEFDDWISERYSRPNHDLKPTENLSPAAAAAQVRAEWGIGQRPIGNAINLLEAHGVRVFSLVEDTRHLDAYSLWRNDVPYVFLNTTKTTERSRHDAFHELGHLVMHHHTGSKHASAEDEANAFASAFLMPREDLLAETHWDMDLRDLIKKKGRWGVSAASLNYALHKAGRLSEWSYRGNYIALGQQYGRTEEPQPMAAETSQVWTKILTDLWSLGFSISRVAKLLGVSEKQLNDLLFGIAGRPTPVPRQPLRSA
jgi:Zn-dependent peptidase ImmA (M78 family)